MNRHYFTKLSGAGNDFILFDLKINTELNLTPEIISRICERRRGIGADGVLLFSDSNDYAFDMTYYNADGSTGSLCANGARCAILYGMESGRFGTEEVKFRVNGSEYRGMVLGKDKVKFFLNKPEKLKFNFKIKARGQLINASFADTGSPHAVVFIKDVLKDPANIRSAYNDLNDFPVLELGREIRHHKDFEPAGTNVNFIDIDGDEINIRSFERGVENETLACGTGSVAAAIIAFRGAGIKTPVKLNVKSGDRLIVDFRSENEKIEGLSLTGPAGITFNGELSI